MTADVRISIAAYDMPLSDLVEMAIAAEASGFEGIWLGEHLAVPAVLTSTHPTSGHDAGTKPLLRPVLGPATVLNDPWVALAAIAARTTRLRIGTGVLILPLWHPLQVARAAATLQHLADGRFRLGVGSGWVHEEFDALGAPFQGRGPRMHQQIDLLRATFGGGNVRADGPHYFFDAVQVCPQPVDVPIVVGGNAPPALRRAARLGDGWISSGTADVDATTRCRDELMQQRDIAGRGHLPFTTWTRLPAVDARQVEISRARGLTDLVVWADQVWPRTGGLTLDQKTRALAAHAEALGLRSDNAELELVVQT